MNLCGHWLRWLQEAGMCECHTCMEVTNKVIEFLYKEANKND